MTLLKFKTAVIVAKYVECIELLEDADGWNIEIHTTVDEDPFRFEYTDEKHVAEQECLRAIAVLKEMP